MASKSEETEIEEADENEENKLLGDPLFEQVEELLLIEYNDFMSGVLKFEYEVFAKELFLYGKFCLRGKLSVESLRILINKIISTAT